MDILIAEDDATCRAVLAGILKKAGHTVNMAVNGYQAWQQLQHAGAPKLVILDWMMPGIGGPEVLRRLRARPTDCPAYVIMLTSRGEKSAVIAGLDAGANDYLVKPFNPGELLARVEVGGRTVEMQLRQHRLRVHAKQVRVAADHRLLELQQELDAKAAEISQIQGKLSSMESHFKAMCEDRARISRELDDSYEPHLTDLQLNMKWIDHQLRATPAPDIPLCCDKIGAMLHHAERLTKQTEAIAATLGRLA